MRTDHGLPVVRLGLIGAGRIGTMHAGNIARHVAGAELAAVADARPEAAQQLAARYGTEARDVDGLLKEMDGVVITSIAAAHLDLITRAAEAGKPVWCEKPLALTRAEAERAIAACKKANVPFALGNNKRCFPSMRELKRVVAEGLIGDVLHIEGNFTNEHSTRVKGGWRDDPRESPGGGMTGAGLHVLDAFVNLAGPIRKVNASVYSQKPPPDPRDATAALVQFESGATGVLATVRAAPMYWRIMVFGSKGSAEAREETMLTVAKIGEQPATQVYPAADSLGVLLESFAETIETGKPFPVSTADMLDVVGAFEAVIRSMAEDRPINVARA